MFKKCDISSVISSTEEFSEQECACCLKKKFMKTVHFASNLMISLIIGDQIGYITIITFNKFWQKLFVWEHNLHQEEIYYLTKKIDQQFYSYSKNNKLILYNQILKGIVFQIDVTIMGYGNFDYCPKNESLIAPNLLGLTIWNGCNGQEIKTSSQLYSADNVVQIFYESNQKNFTQSLEIEKIIAKRIFDIYGVVTNISWLEDGKYFIMFFSDQLQVRSTKCHRLPLRFRYKTNSKTTFFDRQNHTGKYLISIEEKHICVYAKQSNK
ncbi:hypothetical protein pb186bvf_009740 [Paramecium bursaria]